MRAKVVVTFSFLALFLIVSGCARRKNRCATCPTWSQTISFNQEENPKV